METHNTSPQVNSEKKSFVLGLVAGAGVFFAVGFFILLFVVLTDSGAATRDTEPSAIGGGGYPPEAAEAQIVVEPVSDEDWFLGNENARVAVIEYSDIECPFCGRFHPTMKRVIEEYGDEVKWVYRHFPLTSIHPHAQRAAEAAECAGHQGGNQAFWDYTDYLFANQRNLNDATYQSAAEQAGLDAAELISCLNAGTYTAKVQKQFQDAQAAGGRGTPHSIIVSAEGEYTPASGALPFEQIEAMIQQAL